MMKIKWYAHAAVLLEGDGLRIITDPYVPEAVGFAPITEAADIVVRSSADDDGHNNAEMIVANSTSPLVVTATEIDDENGATARGVSFMPIHSRESLIYKERPRDNAMYRFTLEDIRIAHLGDVGNRLEEGQLEALQGIDILIAPTGGAPTIDLKDLYDAIQVLKPRVIIPMHYALPGAIPKMVPVTAFTNLFSPEQIVWLDTAEVEFSTATLPKELTVYVLKPSTAGST
jgi:L-ascorbate metabolism protein UlaG (beta-lactamase superfamily)